MSLAAVRQRWKSPRVRKRAGLVGVVLVLGAALATGVANLPPAGLLRRLPTSEGNLSCVLFSPDGKWLASGAGSGKVFLWEAAEARPLPLRQFSQQPITALAFSRDNFLTAGTLSQSIIVWNLKDRTAQMAPPVAAPITCMAAHPQRRELAIGMNNGKLHFLNTVTADYSVIASEHAGSVKALVFDRAGGLLATAGADGKVIVRDATTRKVKQIWGEHAADVSCLNFNDDGSQLASGDWTGRILVRRVADGQVLATVERELSASGVGFAGEWLATACWGRWLQFVRLADPTQTVAFDTGQLIQALAVSPDGQTVATISPAARVQLWKTPEVH